MLKILASKFDRGHEVLLSAGSQSNGRGGVEAARPRRLRVAVVSPFLDQSHGTERMVIQWITRLADTFEIHIYAQQVEDCDISKFVLHRIPKLPGPHLLNFLWWFAANHWRRWRDSRSKGLHFDLVYSPGTNCLDADAVTIHIVFAEFVRRVGRELKFRRNPVRLWPRLLHRRLYYRTIMFLERRVFLNPGTQLIVTAPQTSEEICRFFARTESFPVLPPGIDQCTFNPQKRSELRATAREALCLGSDRFALLLIGNDWRKKGLGTLIGALAQLTDLSLELLVAGHDDPAPFIKELHALSLQDCVRFVTPRKDVEFYFAAADAYVAPSLEDTFALPASEAMACGLPTIISARAGAAAIATNGVDALILDDPTDKRNLAHLIRSLCENSELRNRLGKNAVATARQYTWERSAQALGEVFTGILSRKRELPSV